MTSSAYFNTVVSQSAFRARFKAENGKTFSDIEDAAASGWGRRHLLACRGLRREPQPNLLPTLSQHIAPSDMQPLPDEIRAFLQGPDLGLMDQSEHSLMRNLGHPISLAQIWSAMATFNGSQDRRMQDASTTQERSETEHDNDPELRHWAVKARQAAYIPVRKLRGPHRK